MIRIAQTTLLSLFGIQKLVFKKLKRILTQQKSYFRKKKRSDNHLILNLLNFTALEAWQTRKISLRDKQALQKPSKFLRKIPSVNFYHDLLVHVY